MAESDDESDFASAESEPEGEMASPVTVATSPTKTGEKPQQSTSVVVDPKPLSVTGEDGATPRDPPQTNTGDDRSTSPATATQDKDDSPQPEAAEGQAALQAEEDDNERTITKPEQQEIGEGGGALSDKETTAPPKEGIDPAHTTEGTAASGGGGWGGWGGWGGLWTSVSTVTESAQALGSKVSSVIASVEDTLGLPTPHDLVEEGGGEGGELDDETSKLAEEMVEHDIPPEDLPPPIQEEPHSRSGPPSPTKDTSPQPHPLQVTEEQQQQQKKLQEEEEEGKEEKEEEEGGAVAHSPSSFGGGFSSFFTGIASAVQTTSKGIGKASLDALETLGKKTFEVLSEGDPGLQKTRSTLAGNKGPTLSQLLLEAKASSDSQIPPADCISKLPLSYSRLFDEFQGVVHLEALELLSKECERKIRGSLASLSGDDLRAAKARMEELKQAFEVEDLPEVLDDDSSQLHEIIELFSTMALPLKVDRLVKVSKSWRDKVETTMAGLETAEEETNKGDDESAREGGEAGDGGDGDEVAEKEDQKTAVFEALYGNGISSLAEMTSTSIELFRKMGEVLLLPDQSQKHNVLEQTQKFNRLTVLVSSELDSLASVHAEAITQLDLKDCNSNITSLYLEASNSCTYVQDAFQLLCPVLQHTLIQQLHPMQGPSANTLDRN